MSDIFSHASARNKNQETVSTSSSGVSSQSSYNPQVPQNINLQETFTRHKIDPDPSTHHKLGLIIAQNLFNKKIPPHQEKYYNAKARTYLLSSNRHNTTTEKQNLINLATTTKLLFLDGKYDSTILANNIFQDKFLKYKPTNNHIEDRLISALQDDLAREIKNLEAAKSLASLVDTTLTSNKPSDAVRSTVAK